MTLNVQYFVHNPFQDEIKDNLDQLKKQFKYIKDRIYALEQTVSQTGVYPNPDLSPAAAVTAALSRPVILCKNINQNGTANTSCVEPFKRDRI